MPSSLVTAAHSQRMLIQLLVSVPAHEPRKSDPYYAIFNATKRRMKAAGLLKCALRGCTYPGPIELHHSHIEFSLQGGVDLEKFNDLYGMNLKDDDEFRRFIEGPGNLEPLCAIHHRGKVGVHELPEPFWNATRVWRSSLAPPAEVQPRAARLVEPEAKVTTLPAAAEPGDV